MYIQCFNVFIFLPVLFHAGLLQPPSTSVPVCRPSSRGEGSVPRPAAQSTPATMPSALTEATVPSYLTKKGKDS